MTTYRYDHDESMNDDMNYNNVSMNGVNENIHDNVGITENDVSMNDVNEIFMTMLKVLKTILIGIGR